MPASIGIPHIEQFWRRVCTLSKGEASQPEAPIEWCQDNTLLGGLRLGNRETYSAVLDRRLTLEQFEEWILSKNGGSISADRVARINAAVDGEPLPPAPGWETAEPALTTEDLAFWEENGYVILHDAVTPDQCAAAANAIYDYLSMDPQTPDTWYGGPQGHSIWVPLLHHPAVWANRDSPRIRRAFEQLWRQPDLWCTVDQVGMNPPEREGWRFPGPHMHWDVSVALPIPFGTQGILYLTDTAADQGAFTGVPGFHHKMESWLNSLPEGSDPRKQDLLSLGAIPIAGRAGDLVIWHHALPHGSSPNQSARPRVVQYINMRPSRFGVNPVWR